MSLDTDFDPYAHLIDAEHKITQLFKNQHLMSNDIGFLHEQVNKSAEVNAQLVEIIQGLHAQQILLAQRVKRLEDGSSRFS